MSNQAAARSVDVGTVVADTYEIVRILGRGGMGTVWEASHCRLPGKLVAIKVLHAYVAEDPDALARFRREAEIACRLGHPNIVEVHDFNKLEDGSPYLILELLEGCSLDERLRAGPLDLQTCEHILRQVGSALQCAHEQNVIHRDLKPQNIFLVPSPTGVGPEIAKVLDFGISKIRGSQTVKTHESSLLGTPQYMAPEQAVGQHDSVDARTDLFALAAMLYELLSGKAAFPGQNIPEVVYKVVHVEPEPLRTFVPDLPAEKAAAIARALSKSQDDRYASVSEFVEAFTGSALPKTRSRRDSIPVAASAETIDSSKLALATARTIDSQHTELPGTAAPESDVAQAATVASQKVTRDPATDATVASGKLEPVQASVQISGEDDPKVQSVAVREVESAASSVAASSGGRAKVRTYVISVVVVCGAALALVLAMPSNEVPKQRPVVAAVESQEQSSAGPVTKSEESEESEESRNRAHQVQAVDASTPADAGAPDASGQTSQERKRGSTGAVRRPARTRPALAQAPANPEVERLLAVAEDELDAGNLRKAVVAARRANRIQRTTQSFVIQAKAHCMNKNLTRAKATLRRIPRRRQAKLRKFCKKSGFELP